MAEVAKHCTRDDAWIIIDERVYDVTRFIDKHPGGVGPMINLAGRDCTDVFGNYVMQKFFEFGRADQCDALLQLIDGHAVELALNM